jgi:hypothetical protein
MEDNTIKLTGTVRKLIDCSLIREPEQAQIALSGAGHLYDELRVPNTLGWKEGRVVEVTIRLLDLN